MRVFHFLRAEHAISALRKSRIKVALIGDLNDPFELLCADIRDPRHRRGFRQFKARFARTFGYLCFTKRWQNLMLWSMYAEKHRGALEIDLADDTAMVVQYRKSRITWDVESIMKTGGFTEEHVNDISTTKSIHWRHEREIRAAVSLADASANATSIFRR